MFRSISVKSSCVDLIDIIFVAIILPNHNKITVFSHCNSRFKLLTSGNAIDSDISKMFRSISVKSSCVDLIFSIFIFIILPYHNKITVFSHCDSRFKLLTGGNTIDGHISKMFRSISVKPSCVDLIFSIPIFIIFPYHDKITIWSHCDSRFKLLTSGNAIDSDISKMFRSISVKSSCVDLIFPIHISIIFPYHNKITVISHCDSRFKLLT